MKFSRKRTVFKFIPKITFNVAMTAQKRCPQLAQNFEDTEARGSPQELHGEEDGDI